MSCSPRAPARSPRPAPRRPSRSFRRRRGPPTGGGRRASGATASWPIPCRSSSGAPTRRGTWTTATSGGSPSPSCPSSSSAASDGRTRCTPTTGSGSSRRGKAPSKPAHCTCRSSTACATATAPGGGCSRRRCPSTTTAVLGLGEMALSSMAPDDPHQKDVADMMKAGMRASEVTRQLLAFSRQQVLQPTVLDVDTVVHELAPVLRRLLGSDRHLDVRTAKTRHRIMADRGQIEQVLINLVVNARDATGTDGLVTVETEEVVLDRPTLSSHNESEAAPGRYVRLAVRDNGSGMDPDVVARAFEPFFTTKAVGHGTGLGLSMVYGIVKQSGGYVRIESATGKGSTMNIYLPAVDAELTAAEAPVVAPRGRGELILVVDDRSEE